MKNFKSVLLLFSLGIVAFSATAFSQTTIWPTIPFIRGADVCGYKDAYGQTRSEYMAKMVGLAKDLMQAKATGKDVLPILVGFNNLYNQNIALATQYNYLDVTLESTLKSYVSEYYRNLRPRKELLSFKNVNDVLGIVQAASQGQRDGYLTPDMVQRLTFIGYGSYSFAPNCKGDILVTLHLTGQDGQQISYIGQGPVQTVMSQIASRLFEDFQRTRFPSTLKVGKKTITLLGGMNGSVDKALSPKNAQKICETLDGRLPTADELEIINAYGDWSGGVSLAGTVWALPGNKVYAPHLMNPSPVREPWEVNEKEVSYFCVQ